jgi:uncharacterized protein (TIGR03437 family)
VLTGDLTILNGAQTGLAVDDGWAHCHQPVGFGLRYLQTRSAWKERQLTLYNGKATWDRAGKVTQNSPLPPGILTISGNGVGDAVALNAATMKTGEFSVTTPENFGADKRTSLMIFASGLSHGVLNTTASNDMTVGGSILSNIAESVVVEARTFDNRIFHLPVQFVGPPGRNYELDQINLSLIEDLRGAGSVELTLIIAGQRSNMATIRIL